MPRTGSKASQIKKRKPPTQCCRWDLTVWDEITSNELRRIFGECCKKYCFQQEKGEETGGLHFQCRVSLKMKKRETEAIKLFSQSLSKFHVSATSNENKDNDFYVMKANTRVDGPFTDRNQLVIPCDVANMKELWAFQRSIFDMHRNYEERKIHFIYEPHGNKGKTRCVRYCCCYGDAEEIPFAKEFRDIMRMAYDLGEKKCYFIDMPRALPKNKMEEFFAGIEKLKSGHVFDDRNYLKVRRFDPPNVIIFSNVLPDKSLLSKDMWVLWTINEDKELVPYVDQEEALLKPPPEIGDQPSSDFESDSDIDTPNLTACENDFRGKRC